MRGRRQGLELHLKTENQFSAKASRTPHHPSAAHRAALRCAPQLPPRRKHVSGRKSGNPANLRDPRPSTHSSLSWQRRSRIGSQAKVSGGTIIANHRLRHTHTAAKPHARNACQGTYPPSRRPQLVLRGPSEGEEATKKLLAIGSASSANSHRPQGMRRNSPATEVRRARMQSRLTRNSSIIHAPLTCLQATLSCSRSPALPGRFASCYQVSLGCGSCCKQAPAPDTPTQVSSSLS